MFRIDEQVAQAFANDAIGAHMQIIEGHLLSVFPAVMRDVSHASRQQFIRLAISRAAPYEINCQQGIAAYCGVMIRLGAFFDESPVYSALHVVLSNSVMRSSIKAMTLSDTSSEFNLCGLDSPPLAA